MPYMNNQKVQLYYEIYGENNPDTIVLIAGLNTQMTCWDESFIKQLVCNKFRVIVFDNRDAGKSTVLSSPNSHVKSLANFLQNPHPDNVEYSLWDMSEDIYDLLFSLHIAKAHIVGRSMGGVIAQLFASKYKNITQSLTLIMSSSFNPDLPKADDVLIQKMTQENFNYKQYPKEYLQEKIALVKLISGKKYPIDEANEKERIIANQARKSPLIKPFRQIIALITYKYDVNVLKRITCPSLIIHGQEDPLFSMASALDLKAHIPNAKLIILPGMGHSMPKDLHATIVHNISVLRSAK